MVAIYSNEGFPLGCVRILRELGYDVLTTQEAGKAEQRISDDEVLRFATVQRRCVVTINRRDFIKLHGQSDAHAGIVACKRDEDFRRLAVNIHHHLHHYEDLSGLLLKVTRETQ